MTNEILLAKPDESLIHHTENTLKVFNQIRNIYSNVPEICGVSNFWKHLFYSLFLHDFGKASSGFQDALKGGESWRYRHEILSAAFISSLKDIFSEDEIKAIGLCIITHHRNLNNLNKYDTFSNVMNEAFIEKLSQITGNIDELNGYFDVFSKLSIKYFGSELKSPAKINFDELINPFPEIIHDYEDEYNSKLHGLYGIYLKGFMNACDYLASGGHYEILNALNFADLLKFDSLRKIQFIASKAKGSTFLIAPTGSGKTEASFLWADNNQNENLSKRIFYILPYTASINAMYERLVNIIGNEDLIGLSYANDSYFIYKALGDDKTYVKQIQSLTKKIYRPYKITTPFQIIKYLFRVKGFEMGLCELTGSLIIIDEVHAYDARTTCLLLETCKFLKEKLHSDIFIMSATLPSFLKNLFQKELSINNLIKLSDKELNEFTRHRVNVVEGGIENCFEDVLNDLGHGRRVLIVCNTVEKSQKIFKCFKQKNIDNSALLHGKFILKDREEIEKKLNNFDLLVGTQSIEVSLDISYDVLYSEPAPFDALIQRFGRINRKGWSEGIIREANVFTWGSENDKYIYNQKIVQKTLKHLKNVNLLKESKIQEILDDIYGDGYSEDDQKTFDEVKKAFGNITERLVPFVELSKNNYYDLFDSIEVVPLKFREEYFDKINNKCFFEAMGYCLNISKGQFVKQNKGGNIEKINGTYFINVKYDSQLGLLLND